MAICAPQPVFAGRGCVAQLVEQLYSRQFSFLLEDDTRITRDPGGRGFGRRLEGLPQAQRGRLAIVPRLLTLISPAAISRAIVDLSTGVTVSQPS